MKLIELRIHNIASFEDVAIPFAEGPLSRAGVFLICGAVGTGKSTILDCITLALFGRTPRLKSEGRQTNGIDLTHNGSKITDPRQLLRRGAGRGQHGKVALLFEHDGHTYEAVWQTPSTRKGARTLTDLTDMRTWSVAAEVDDRISRILHLDFGQFCRTTTLAQGDFAKFLRSTDTEKADILEKIVGVEIYTRIGAAIYERERQARTDVDTLRQRMADLVMLSDSELQRLRDELTVLTDRGKALAKRSDLLTAAISWLRNTSILEKQLLNAESRFNRARDDCNSPGFKSLCTDIADFDLTADARTALTRVGKLTKDIAAEEKHLQADVRAFDVIAQRLVLFESKVVRLAARKTEIEDALSAHQPRLTLYANLPILTSLFTQLTDAERHIARASRQLSHRQKIVTQELMPQADRAKALVAVKEAEIDSSRRALAADVQTALKVTIPHLRTLIAEATRECARLTEKEREAKAAVEALQMATGTTARGLRASLTAGCTCPICRQRVGALPSDIETTLNRLLAESRAAAAETSDALRRKESCRMQLDNDLANLDSETTAILAMPEIAGLEPGQPSDGTGTLDSLRRCRSTLANLKSELIDAKNTESDISRRLADAQKADGIEQANINNSKVLASSAKEKIATLFDEAGETADCSSTESLGLRIKATAAQSRDCDTLSKSLQTTAAEFDNLQALKGRLEAKVRATDKLTGRCRSNVAVYNGEAGEDTLETEFDVLNSEIRVRLANIETFSMQKREAESLVISFLTSHQSLTRQRLEALAAIESARLKAMRDDVNSRRQRLESAGGALAQCRKLLEEHLKQRPADIGLADAPALADEKAAIDLQLAQTMKSAASVEERIAADTANRNRHLALAEEYESRKALYDDWHSLGDLLGDKNGDRFRRIALSFILDNLIEQANIYMSRLTDRYTLALKPGTFIILVRDAYQGFAERATTTISGGETFMVSLALALALSDLGGNARGADILFIDEGFGSLSGEELFNAIDMLRNIHHTASRRVGIISHIPELAERIPVQLRVSRIGRTAASTIEITG